VIIYPDRKYKTYNILVLHTLQHEVLHFEYKKCELNQKISFSGYLIMY
jgi:hypothetical protein